MLNVLGKEETGEDRAGETVGAGDVGAGTAGQSGHRGEAALHRGHGSGQHCRPWALSQRCSTWTVIIYYL